MLRVEHGIAVPRFILKRARDPWSLKACECGAVKSKRKAGCKRCLALDPEAWPEQDRCDSTRRVLLALRDGAELTLYEIAAAIGVTPRNTLRTLHKLVAEGRLRSWLEDQDTHETTAKRGLHGRYCKAPTKRYRRIWKPENGNSRPEAAVGVFHPSASSAPAD